MKRIYIVCIATALLLAAGCSTKGPQGTGSAAPADTSAATTAPAEATQGGQASPETTAASTEAPTASPKPTFPAELGPAELEFVYEGQAFRLGEDIQPLLDALGEEYDLSESASKLYDGSIRLYDYGDMLVTTYPKDGKDVVGEVEFTGEDYQTRRGVMIGDSPNMVAEDYGDGYVESDGAMTFPLGDGATEKKGPRIVFEVADDIVVGIRMYGEAEIK